MTSSHLFVKISPNCICRSINVMVILDRDIKISDEIMTYIILIALQSSLLKSAYLLFTG
jgi:hypothetical protein